MVNYLAGSKCYPPKVIKTVSEEIVLHFLVVFNLSTDEGRFPTNDHQRGKHKTSQETTGASAYRQR